MRSVMMLSIVPGDILYVGRAVLESVQGGTVPDTTTPDRIRCPAFSRMFPKNRCERAASGISPGTKNFFAKASFTQRLPLVWAGNHFLTGFWERGRDYNLEMKSPPYRVSSAPQQSFGRTNGAEI